jgi:hypothetical protein
LLTFWADRKLCDVGVSAGQLTALTIYDDNIGSDLGLSKYPANYETPPKNLKAVSHLKIVKETTTM